MSRFHVRGKVVDTVDLLRKRNLPWRIDVWPFAIIYAVWIVVLIPSVEFVDALIILGGLVAVHVLVFLFTVWSVDFKCFIQYSKVRYVLPAVNCISIFFAAHMTTMCYMTFWSLENIDVSLSLVLEVLK